jgi:hypothetical protein
MPYITQERRAVLNESMGKPQTAGELNYMLTVLVRDYFNEHRNYQGINDIVGALEGAKLEFYRRQVAEYENTKIAENGDVY